MVLQLEVAAVSTEDKFSPAFDTYKSVFSTGVPQGGAERRSHDRAALSILSQSGHQRIRKQIFFMTAIYFLLKKPHELRARGH